MTQTRLFSAVAAVVMSLGFVGCGSNVVGPSGGTVRSARGALVEVPRGAVETEVELQIREVERRNGELEAVEIEPAELELKRPVRVELQRGEDEREQEVVHREGEDDRQLADVRDDRVSGRVESRTLKLGRFSVRLREALEHEAAEKEAEHARACSPVCETGFECDDGVCKPHAEAEAEHARSCTPACATGLECDDGVCKAHDEAEGQTDGGVEPEPEHPTTCTPACAAGLECDNGVCKEHGRRG